MDKADVVAMEEAQRLRVYTRSVASRIAHEHPTLVFTLVYLSLTLVGAGYDLWLFFYFKINILDYSGLLEAGERDETAPRPDPAHAWKPLLSEPRSTVGAPRCKIRGTPFLSASSERCTLFSSNLMVTISWRTAR